MRKKSFHLEICSQIQIKSNNMPHSSDMEILALYSHHINKQRGLGFILLCSKKALKYFFLGLKSPVSVI